MAILCLRRQTIEHKSPGIYSRHSPYLLLFHLLQKAFTPRLTHWPF